MLRISEKSSLAVVRRLVACAFAYGCALSALAVDFYVSTSGNDANDGSAADAAHALLSVEAGVAKARAYMLANPDSTVTVNVGEGTFALTNGITLHARTSLKGAGRGATTIDAKGLETTDYTRNAVALTNALSSLRSLTLKKQVLKTNQGCRGVSMSAGRIEDCRITAFRTSIYGNYHNGAGIYMSGGMVTNSVIDTCSIVAMYNHGGGVYMCGGEIVDCEFHSNKIGTGMWADAGNDGSAICIEKGSVRRCNIHDNGEAGQSQFGAVSMNGSWSGTQLLENCLIVNNKGGGITAVYSKGEGSVIRYCTITGNATGSGSVRMNKWYYNSMVNNIIWGNASETVADVVFASGEEGKSTFKSNLVTRAISGRETANFTGDPLFINASTNDYRLGARTSSAAYGRALPIAAVTTDYALKPRDATAPSIGAYEYDPDAVVLSVNVTIDKTVCLYGDASAFASVIGAETGEYEVEWFLDGTSVGKGVSMTFPTADYGTHDVKATVTTDTQSKSTEVKDAFTVRTDIAYVNNTGNGTYPYASPLTATNDLAEAIKAVWTSASDPRVSIGAGTFALKGDVSIAVPVRIFGAGADKTRLTCGASVYTAITINNANCKISDLMIADGCCRAVDLQAGEVSRCIITNFTSPTIGSYEGLGVRLGGNGVKSTGVLRDSEIVDCRLYCNYRSGGGITMSDSRAVVTNCVVRKCSTRIATGQEKGGGVSLENGSIYNTRIIDCGSDSLGLPGMALYQGNGLVRGCAIEGTRMSGPSYAVVQVASGTFESCTVTENKVGSAALAVSGGTVRNVVVHGNATTKQLTQSAGTVTYCCYDEATEGENGNRVSSGSMFIGRAHGNYYPKTSSPCFNGGLYQSWMDTAKDLSGNARILKGSVDIGAYESNPKGFSLIVR